MLALACTGTFVAGHQLGGSTANLALGACAGVTWVNVLGPSGRTNHPSGIGSENATNGNVSVPPRLRVSVIVTTLPGRTDCGALTVTRRVPTAWP
jgi:hypothetical protein